MSATLEDIEKTNILTSIGDFTITRRYVTHLDDFGQRMIQRRLIDAQVEATANISSKRLEELQAYVIGAGPMPDWFKALASNAKAPHEVERPSHYGVWG